MKRLIIVLLIAFPILAASQIINVPGDYSTIQEGIDAAANGDTVLVQPGTYPEHLTLWDKTITLASLFLTTGDTSYIASTIIDGQNNGRILSMQSVGEDGHICGFMLINGYVEDSWGGGIEMTGASPIISDMVIMDCSARRGGGISAVISNVTFKNVWLQNNEAIERAAGIWIQNSNAYMEDCVLVENNSPTGSAIYYHINSMDPMYYNVNIQSCLILNNTAFGQTAGLFIRHDGSNSELNISIIGSDFTNNTAAANGALQIRGDSVNFILENCRFQDNTVSDFTAGAAFVAGCYGEVVNCLVSSNIADTSGGNWNGGGFTLWGTGTEVSILNSTFADNDAGYGDGIALGPGTIAYATNSIFWNNGDQPFALVAADTIGAEMYIDYCDVQYGMDSIRVDPYSNLTWEDHNITGDPLFPGSGSDEYSLTSGSPCIDSGLPDTTGMDFPPYDIIGNVRFWDGNGGGTAIIDMGAYEFGAPVWVGVDDPEDITIRSNIDIEVYPNPCRDMLNIIIDTKKTQRISADLYSISGHNLRQLLNRVLLQGTTRASIDLSDIPAGMYFLNFRFEGYSETRKIVIL